MLLGVRQIGQKLRLNKRPIMAIIQPIAISSLKRAINITNEVITKLVLAVFLLFKVFEPTRNGKPIIHKINAAVVGLVITPTFC